MTDRRTYSQERIELAKAYPGKKWATKVMNMSDAQVHEALVNVRKRREQKENRA